MKGEIDKLDLHIIPEGLELPHLLIVGGGDTGTEIARRTLRGWRVTLVDQELSQARQALADHPGAENLTLLEGDGTSRLVLDRAGAAKADAAVVTTAPDEVSAEVSRVLKRDFAIPRVWAHVRHVEATQAFADTGVDVVHDYEATAAVLVSQLTWGSKVAACVGLGAGEIMESTILPNSSIINKPLNSLRPNNWLVAAVYRGGKLIVPHGYTTLSAGDRVLLVGDPSILPLVARLLRSGHSEFPLHYGSNILAPLTPQTLKSLPEIAYVMESSRAKRLELLSLDGKGKNKGLEEQARETLGDRPIEVNFAQADGGPKDSLATLSRGRGAGVLVMHPDSLSLLGKLGLAKSGMAKEIAQVSYPVLLPRGTFPYTRVLLAITDEAFDMEASTLAIDVVRMFDARLTAAIGVPPEFVAGPGVAVSLRKSLQTLEELVTAYCLRVETVELSGNPVHGLLKMAEGYQLMILGFRRDKRASLLRPPVEQNLMHQAPCSVLVLPH